MQLLDHLFAECRNQGEALVNKGVITIKDIEETKSGKVGSGVLNVGLPAYVILNALLGSAKADSVGLILIKYSLYIAIRSRLGQDYAYQGVPGSD